MKERPGRLCRRCASPALAPEGALALPRGDPLHQAGDLDLGIRRHSLGQAAQSVSIVCSRCAGGPSAARLVVVPAGTEDEAVVPRHPKAHRLRSHPGAGLGGV